MTPGSVAATQTGQFTRFNWPTAAAGTLNASVQFDSDVVGKLRDISNRTLKLATRSALGKAGTRIAQEVRPHVPSYTGLLRQAILKKDSKHTSKAIYSLVGASRKIEGPAIKNYVSKAKKARRARRPFIATRAVSRVRKPSRYLHLVERGHKLPQGGFRRGHFMMTIAKATTQNEVREIVRRTLSERLASAKQPDEITTT